MRVAPWPWRRIALAALAAAVGLRLASLGLSQAVDEWDQGLALALNGSNARALTLRAERALNADAPSLEDARRDAGAALRAEPLSYSIHRLLARLAEADGRLSEAEALWRLAGRTLRDSQAQAWWFSRAAQERNWDAAMEKVDLIYRTQPRSWGQINQALIAILADGEFREALARKSATKPIWRDALMGQIIRTAPDTGQVTALVQSLAQSGDVMPDGEFRLYLERLVLERRFEEARALFAERLPPERRGDVGRLYNANFEHGQSNAPFDWVIAPSPAAVMGVLPVGSRNVLRVEFFGGRAPFANVSRLLMLPPGAYRFSGQEMAEDLRNERGLSWRIACAKGGQTLGATPLLRGRVAWRPFGLDFTVPEECPVQTLVLEIPTRLAIEQETSGGAAYADFALEALTQ